MIRSLLTSLICIRTAFAALLAVALLFSAFQGAMAHVPQSQEIAQIHMDDHGHSHGDVVDQLWSDHGHSHDVTDHDHSPVLLFTSRQTHSFDLRKSTHLIPHTQAPSGPTYSLKRPPRL